MPNHPDKPTNNSNNEDNTDQAWVTVDSGLPLDRLKTFCDDIERLFRINPYLEFSEIKVTANDKIYLKGKNLSNERSFDCYAQRISTEDGYQLIYQDGLKRSTQIIMSAQAEGSQLKIVDDYSGISEQERNERLDEVDKSLPAWGNALQKYLSAWHKWSDNAIWRWYKEKLWLPMKPSSRRISWMLVNITALEFLAFLMVFTIFWLELDKYFGG